MIMLGNLSVEQMEKRLGITLSDEHRAMLVESRQEPVNNIPLGAGKWHCFDIPFLLECDTKATAEKFYAIFKNYAIQCQFQIGWERSQA